MYFTSYVLVVLVFMTIPYIIIYDNNVHNFHWLKVHHVAFILFRYRRECAPADYNIARLGSINNKIAIEETSYRQ